LCFSQKENFHIETDVGLGKTQKAKGFIYMHDHIKLNL